MGGGRPRQVRLAGSTCMEPARAERSIKPMTCTDYVAAFTDYLDGSVPEEDVRAFEAHLETCATCRRYRAVVEKAGELLRALPQPTLTEDFGPRLQHRLFHVDEEPELEGATSATPAVTVLGMAVLLTAMAWSPTLWERVPEIMLEPIVVQYPRVELPVRPVSALPEEGRSRSRPASDFERGLWDDAHVLLYEYSPLSQRYPQRGRVRKAGTDQGR